MIDFTATQQSGDNGPVEYLNKKGEIVERYPFNQFLEWTSELLYMVPTHTLSNEEYQDLLNAIDNRWREIAELFYNDVNKEEFKSENSYNQTKKVY